MSDLECASGEGCVLQHCVPSLAIGCRSRLDCRPDELCALSGYSMDLRGNHDMRAFCLPTSGGTERVEATLESFSVPKGDSVTPGDLLEVLRER